MKIVNMAKQRESGPTLSSETMKKKIVIGQCLPTILSQSGGKILKMYYTIYKYIQGRPQGGMGTILLQALTWKKIHEQKNHQLQFCYI